MFPGVSGGVESIDVVGCDIVEEESSDEVDVSVGTDEAVFLSASRVHF